jgi:hypothetical protein
MRKMVRWPIALAALLCGIAIVAPANAATTSGLNESLLAVSCVSAKFCVAVGTGPVDAKGTFGLISLIWTGAKWRRVVMKASPGNSSVVSESVSCRSAAYCVAVGSGSIDGSRPFAQTWNGRTWTLALPPEPAGVIGTSLGGVSCAAVRACVADGFTETPGGNDLPLVETLTGTKWTIRRGSLPRGVPGAGFAAVSCPAIAFCVLAGSYDITDTFAPLFESWNGKVFTRMKTPAPSDVATAGVSCVSARSCVAVDDAVNGVDGAITSSAEVWNGSAWSPATTFPNGTPTSVLNAVSCARGGCMGAGGRLQRQ